MPRVLPYILATLLVLFLGVWALYAFGVPLLERGSISCSSRGKGCGTVFGEFAIVWFIGVGLALAAIWQGYRRP